MKSIEDLLEPFTGYLDLGMYLEAHEELENLPAEAKAHPWTSLARLTLLVETGGWQEGIRLGTESFQKWPQEHEFYFKTAYCLHELKRTEEAKETLEAAPGTIRKTALYHYNLACYETQLGNIDKAKHLLKRCFAIEPAYKEEAAEDPDLEPLGDWL